MRPVVRLLPLFMILVAGVVVWRLLDSPSRETHHVEVVDDASPAVSEARLEGREAGTPTAPGDAPEPPGDAPAFGTVTVSTVHYGTGGAMPGVLVVAVDAAGRRREGRTNAEGRVTFAELALGRARFEAVAPGWIAESEERFEVAGDPGHLHLALQRAVGAEGQVLSAADDAPVAGARVVASAGTVGYEGSRKRGDVWDVVETDGEGRFVLDAIPLGDDVTVTVLARGFAREVRLIVVREESGASQNHLFRLRPGATIRGTVVDRSGRPAPGAGVYVYPDGEPYLRDEPRGGWTDGVRTVASLRGAADADGRFVVRGLALDGRYAATAFAAGYVRAEDVGGLATSPDQRELSVTLVLRTPATLEVVVQDEAGRPVAGAEAAVGDYAYGMRGNDAEGVTDADGRVRLGGLSPGSHRLRIESDEHLPFEERVEIREGETRRIDAQLHRGATISGIVVDGTGRPLADVRVVVEHEGGERRPRIPLETGDDGRFVISGLEARPHGLCAWGSGYVFDSIGRVVAPAADVRIVGVPLSVARGRLVLPPGTPTPERILVGSYDASGGGGGSHRPWPMEPIVWHLGAKYRILRVEGEGFAPWELEVDLVPGEDIDLGEIRLPPGVDLGGVVVERDGKPVAGAAVEAVRHSFRATQTDAQGRFELRHLRPGRQELDIRASGFLVRSVDANRAITDRELRIILARGGALHVRLLDAKDLPVVGVEVEVERSDGREPERSEDFENWRAWDETDEQGRMRARLAPGTYRVVAGTSGQPLAEAEVTLEDGETTEATLHVP